MKIRLIWIGRTKEGFVKNGIDKYLKGISPFCDFKIVEIKEAKDSDRTKALKKEGERIVQTAPDFVLLHEKGKELTSMEFADFLKKKSGHVFVIGGPYGVSDVVKERASDILSLSKMTFTHDMVRIIFLEQVYRAFTILHKRGYHH